MRARAARLAFPLVFLAAACGGGGGASPAKLSDRV
jgi:hypothetical protein